MRNFKRKLFFLRRGGIGGGGGGSGGGFFFVVFSKMILKLFVHPEHIGLHVQPRMRTDVVRIVKFSPKLRRHEYYFDFSREKCFLKLSM